jgi:glyoxylase-like metal-dependent hydrolase (beta-lactamase superfamily II)
MDEESALFTGDTVLGGSSSIFSCFHEYMESLHALRSLQPLIVYPAHGPVATDATHYIDEYINHRQRRERQILDAIAERQLTISEIVSRVYVETPNHLRVAASGNVLHHLKKLLISESVEATSGDAGALHFLTASNDYETSGEGVEGDKEMLMRVFCNVQWASRSVSRL